MEQNSGLSEKELMQDLLMCEKHGTESYSVGVTESSCSNLRQVLTQFEQNIFKSLESVFKTMNEKGWYQTKKADSQEVQQAKDTFNQFKNQLV